MKLKDNKYERFYFRKRRGVVCPWKKSKKHREHTSMKAIGIRTVDETYKSKVTNNNYMTYLLIL